MKSLLAPFPNLSGRFKVIHVDIIGPLSPSSNYRYCLTVIDRFTRLVTADASTVAQNLYQNWIARFGVPQIVVTDQGRQFESTLFRDLSKLLGFNRHRTSPYHPQSNGCIERWHRTLKTAIMSCDTQNWHLVLPLILLSFRNTPIQQNSLSPAEMVYGEKLRSPSELVTSNQFTQNPSYLISELQNFLWNLKPPPASKHTKKDSFIFKELDSCTHVMVRTDMIKKPLQQPYKGPFEVVRRQSKFFTIQINNKHKNISIDRLKPAVMNTSSRPSQPTTSFNSMAQ